MKCPNLPCRLLIGSLDGVVSPTWYECLRCAEPGRLSGESLIWCSFLRTSPISGEFLLTTSFLRASTISGEWRLTRSGEWRLNGSLLRASMISGEPLWIILSTGNNQTCDENKNHRWGRQRAETASNHNTEMNRTMPRPWGEIRQKMGEKKTTILKTCSTCISQ